MIGTRISRCFSLGFSINTSAWVVGLEFFGSAPGMEAVALCLGPARFYLMYAPPFVVDAFDDGCSYAEVDKRTQQVREAIKQAKEAKRTKQQAEHAKEAEQSKGNE